MRAILFLENDLNICSSELGGQFQKVCRPYFGEILKVDDSYPVGCTVTTARCVLRVVRLKHFHIKKKAISKLKGFQSQDFTSPKRCQ